MRKQRRRSASFLQNKIQISPTRQQKLGIFTFFHYKFMGSISCHSNQSSYPIKTKTQLFFPPTCRWCMYNMRTIGPAVSKKIFEIVDDERTPEHGYTISSPMTFGSGELKTKKISRKKGYFFFIFAQNIDCGYTLEPPRRGGAEAVLTSTHNLCFRAKIRKISIPLHTPV